MMLHMWIWTVAGILLVILPVILVAKQFNR